MATQTEKAHKSSFAACYVLLILLPSITIKLIFLILTGPSETTVWNYLRDIGRCKHRLVEHPVITLNFRSVFRRYVISVTDVVHRAAWVVSRVVDRNGTVDERGVEGVLYVVGVII